MLKNVNKRWFRKNLNKLKVVVFTAFGITSVVGGTIGVVNHINDNNRDYSTAYTYDKDEEGTYTAGGYVFKDGVVIGEDDSYQSTEDLTINNQPIEDKIDITIPEDTNFVDASISFKDLDVSQDLNSIREFKVDYEESEHFYTDEALAKYYNIQEYDTVTHNNYIVNGKVDSAKLRDKVIANNKAYLADTLKYTEYNSSTFDTIFNAIVETLNREINENTDIEQLNDNLDNLKILNGRIQANGYLTEDKILVVNSEHVLKAGGTDFLAAVAGHETIHLIQAASKLETQKEGYQKNTGLYFEWSDLKVNPLANQWFVEGAAERIMNEYNEVSDDLVAYPNNVKSMDSITLSALIRPDVDSLTIPRLTMQQDFDKLFDLFNCQTDEEKQEVVNMLFSFEIIYNGNQDFYNESGRAYDNKLNYSLSSSICQTLTKNFYTNLYNSVSTGEENLSTIFSLISTFEADMNRITKFYDTSKYEYNQDFIDMYVRIQDQFFQRISETTNMSKEEVYGMYSDYYKSVPSLSSTKNLDSDEIEFVNDLQEDRESIRASKTLSTFR